jgi:hypothetical protein
MTIYSDTESDGFVKLSEFKDFRFGGLRLHRTVKKRKGSTLLYRQVDGSLQQEFTIGVYKIRNVEWGGEWVVGESPIGVYNGSLQYPC